MNKKGRPLNKKNLRHGSYSVVLTIVFVAVIILANVGVSALGDALNWQVDMTQNELYSISDATEKLLTDLGTDINIYQICKAGQEDTNVDELLKVYSGKNKHISVSTINPNTSPAAIKPYLSTDVTSIAEGSVVVAASDNSRFRILTLTDLYTVSYDSTTYETTKNQFIAESALTTAINYIVNGTIQNVYFLQGHGETLFESDQTLSYLVKYLKAENYNVDQLIINEEPDKLKQGDIVFIFNPKSDLDDSERQVLTKLFDNGGRVFMCIDPVTLSGNDTDEGIGGTEKLANFKALLKLYGVTLDSGMVIDQNSQNYIGSSSYLVPSYGDHVVVNVLKSSNYRIITPNSGSISVASVLPESDINITPIAVTSSDAYLKKDISGSYDKRDEDKVGQYTVAIAVEKAKGETENDYARLVLNYSVAFLDYNAVQEVSSSGINNNIAYVMNAMSWLKNSDNEIYVRGKSLNQSALMFTSSMQIYTVLIIVCIVVPAIVFIAAIVVYLRRKNL